MKQIIKRNSIVFRVMDGTRGMQLIPTDRKPGGILRACWLAEEDGYWGIDTENDMYLNTLVDNQLILDMVQRWCGLNNLDCGIDWYPGYRCRLNGPIKTICEVEPCDETCVTSYIWRDHRIYCEKCFRKFYPRCEFYPDFSEEYTYEDQETDTQEFLST